MVIVSYNGNKCNHSIIFYGFYTSRQTSSTAVAGLEKARWFYIKTIEQIWSKCNYSGSNNGHDFLQLTLFTGCVLKEMDYPTI